MSTIYPYKLDGSNHKRPLAKCYLDLAGYIFFLLSEVRGYVCCEKCKKQWATPACWIKTGKPFLEIELRRHRTTCKVIRLAEDPTVTGYGSDQENTQDPPSATVQTDAIVRNPPAIQ